jgi:DNA polymerase
VRTVFLDIETFNHLDLRKTAGYAYAEHPSFEILMCAWAIDDEPVQVADTPADLFDLLGELLWLPDARYVAHNSAFERACFSRYLGMPVGMYLDPERWYDTMPMAANESYPQSLGKLAKALKTTPKGEAGTLLINLFSKLNRKGERNTAATHPEKWAEFKAYCAGDVETMRECWHKLPQQTPAERAVWLADQRINDRGIRVDLPMAHAAVAAAEENKQAAIVEVREITGIDNPKSVQQLLAWLEDAGLGTGGDLRADTVKDLLTTDLKPDVRRVLELRQELALSASAKYLAAVNMANSDGRLRGSARYYGAHTGRWGGRGVQLQNLPRASLGRLEPLAILDLLSGFGASPAALKALVRPLLLGPITVVDYSAIEARITAWLAGETWMLDEFRGDGKIYERTAERMGIADPYGAGRQSGKVASLALGFSGGVGALKKMGGEKLGDDEYLQGIVNKWRRASPRIVRYWDVLWNAFLSADGGKAGRITVRASKGVRRVELPSGREIVYRNLRRMWDHETGKTGYAFTHPTGKGVRLWRGILIENVVQGAARDLLAYSLPKLEAAELPVVAHVHDESIVDGSHFDEVRAIMTELPGWANGLPLDADGDVKERYAK